MPSEKPLWRKSLNKLQELIADPDIKRFANVGGKILNVASQLGQAKLSGPLSMAGAAVGLLDIIANQTQNGFYTAVNNAAKKHKLHSIDAAGAVALLFEQGYFKNGEILLQSEHGSVVAAVIEDKKIAVVLNKEGRLQPWWCAFASESFTTSSIADLLWDGLGNNVTLTFRKGEYGGEFLTAAPIKGYDSIDYIGQNDPVLFVKKYKEYQAAGINRAFLAVGPPGTGKTTFCFLCAQQFGGKLMIITPELLDNSSLPQQDIIEIVAAFEPSVLLFDDVDRVTKDSLLLSLMEYIRHNNLHTILMSTANDPKNITGALKRPGRLGPRLNFPAPDLALRKQLIVFYSKKIGLQRDISHLAESMEHPLFSHDYVKDVCEQALVESDTELVSYIARVKIDLGEVKTETPPENKPVSADARAT